MNNFSLEHVGANPLSDLLRMDVKAVLVETKRSVWNHPSGPRMISYPPVVKQHNIQGLSLEEFYDLFKNINFAGFVVGGKMGERNKIILNRDFQIERTQQQNPQERTVPTESETIQHQTHEESTETDQIHVVDEAGNRVDTIDLAADNVSFLETSELANLVKQIQNRSEEQKKLKQNQEKQSSRTGKDTNQTETLHSSYSQGRGGRGNVTAANSPNEQKRAQLAAARNTALTNTLQADKQQQRQKEKRDAKREEEEREFKKDKIEHQIQKTEITNAENSATIQKAGDLKKRRSD